MASTAVVVPYQAGPHRGEALRWVLAQYARTFPATPVYVSEYAGPWCKAQAIVPAVRRIVADIVVVADADVWTPGLLPALVAVHAGASWAVPHWHLHRLTVPATAMVLQGASWQALPTAEQPYVGLVGGGMVVARRSTLLACPPDPRFIGWGCEDEAWGFALTTLHGQPWRGTADMVHLWHPPQERATRRFGTLEGRALRRRYAKALRRPDIMQALVQEAHDAFGDAQPAVHHRSPQ